MLSVLLVNPASSFAQEKFDSAQLGFGMPDIVITPTSGPAGTEIEIKVKNMPPPPKGNDPRIEFFMYLPFVTALGDDNVKNNCDGEHCIPLYSFEEINADKVAPKTIMFSLFSDQNPKPTLQNGLMESVCDVKINGQTVERYSTVCIDKNQPPGNYEIKFAWGIQRSNLFDIKKTLTFTVTESVTTQGEKLQNPDDIIFDKYKNGEITEEEFVKQLTSLGYDANGIRQAKALLGKLPHQQGSFSPEQKQAVEEGIKKAEEQSKLDREQSEKTAENFVGQDTVSGKTDLEEKTVVDEEKKSGGCLIATAAYGTEMASQVQLLREIRDKVLFSTNSGTGFMTSFNAIYYSFSPTIADWERQSPIFKEVVKIAITPMLSTLSILNYANIDSESEMLGYGIGIMLLNTGMYFVMPAIVITKARKYFKN
ncbi:MAG: hypothetical protein EPO63_04185 [Candidatus Nitrosotenuis sp.]|nr:MAG: hypothetical protein EPO63_04185 [Candidatus Nitrosotenuis sp.]